MSFKTPHTVRRAAYERALKSGDPDVIEAALEDLMNHPPESQYDVLEYALKPKKPNRMPYVLALLAVAVLLLALCV